MEGIEICLMLLPEQFNLCCCHERHWWYKDGCRVPRWNKWCAPREGKVPSGVHDQGKLPIVSAT
eukprot:7599725-Ditylum_brightwellii.AAC.1